MIQYPHIEADGALSLMLFTMYCADKANLFAAEIFAVLHSSASVHQCSTTVVNSNDLRLL